jgi:ferredoxin--NADP+ reductase/benzoate/toluate 1,2-dioxygenase reductase subunit
MKNLDTTLFHKIELKRQLTPVVTVLRFERKTLDFVPGQYLYVGIPGANYAKPYSIYSGINDPYIEIIVKIAESGGVSGSITQLSEGDYLEVLEPKGHFCIPRIHISDYNFLFIATGVGIAPFRSYVRSYPELKYTLIHGIQSGTERFDFQEYQQGKYISCTSRDRSGDFHGRVTDFFLHNEPKFDSAFLCGSGAMVKEMVEIMTKKGVNPFTIRTEIFY